MIARCRWLFLVPVFLLPYLPVAAQALQEGIHLELNPNGTMRSLSFGTHAAIPLMHDTCTGFRWYGKWEGKYHLCDMQKVGDLTFSAKAGDLQLSLQYVTHAQKLEIIATATNKGTSDFVPEKLGLITGISHYMGEFPQWNNVYFPTMLRCEKTHFEGYLSSPDGNILAIASPDSLASWSLNYNYGYGGKEIFFWGHRIYSSNLDLINSQPLPARHPQQLTTLKRGESKVWHIYVQPVNGLGNLPTVWASLTKAPYFSIGQTTVESGKTIDFDVLDGYGRSISIVSPQGRKYTTTGRLVNGNVHFVFLPKDGPGVYTLTAVNKSGKTTQAMVSVRQPWGWYLQKAGDAALKYTQKASWNCENWYGLYSAYLSQAYYPDPMKYRKTDSIFHQVFDLMYDSATATVLRGINGSRIQNTSTMIGILVDKYRAGKKITDLAMASDLAEHIILPSQTPDGAFRNGKTHYTSVIYIAKSLMELTAEEKKLGASDPFWKKRYETHYASVHKAIDQLMGGWSQIETEGEGTFEDGMIACTGLQIAAFALLQPEGEPRTRYIQRAEEIMREHQCLRQLMIPDSRQRGGSLRFWEAQYDVLFGHNMLTSPHGWSAWSTYATYYLYLLTGKMDYLRQTMNALGSEVQLVDAATGGLRWAFVVDPFVKTNQIAENFPGTSAAKFNANQYKSEEGKTKPVLVGEQYVPLIADWFSANSSDNDVHEIFKCMEEIALGKGYVAAISDKKGIRWLTYNCTVTQQGNSLIIHSQDDRFSQIHFNIPNGQFNVEVPQWNKKATGISGMQWLEKN